MTQETELIKCECGAEADAPVFDGRYYDSWFIECSKCINEIEAQTKEQAIRLWNKAMQPEDLTKAQLIDALDGLVKDIETTNNQKIGLRCFFHAKKALEKAKGDK